MSLVTKFRNQKRYKRINPKQIEKRKNFKAKIFAIEQKNVMEKNSKVKIGLFKKRNLTKLWQSWPKKTREDRNNYTIIMCIL